MPAYFFRSEPGAAELRRLARHESGRVCQRVLMIANLLEGMEHEEAARLAGLSRSAAYEWHNRYEEEGIEGLRDRPRPGRQPRVDAVTSARFKERIVAGAELERDGVVAFRAVDAQRILKEEFEIDCSLSSTYRLLRNRDPSAPLAGCRFAPTPGSGCSSGRCEPRPETIPRLAYRALAPPGLALIAIQQLRKRRLRRRIGLRVARARRQPTQLYPMQQPVGARQAAIDIKLLLQYSLCVDRAKRHYPVPLQLGASDNPLLEPRARHRVYPWLSTRTRPITQSLDAVLFIPVMPFVSR